jgi:hypothetical protein
MSSPTAPLSVQSPLNLMLNIQPGKNQTILDYLVQNQAKINAALAQVGTVHFARFLMIPGTQYLFVITTYDGDFDAYIQAFTNIVGDVFNLLRSGASAPGATECRRVPGLRETVQPADGSLLGLSQLHRDADIKQRMQPAAVDGRGWP